MSFDDPMGIYQVDYQSHYKQFAAPFARSSNPSEAQYFENQAKEMHVLSVANALNDLVSDALVMLEVVALTPEGDRYLRYGIMRRIRLMQSAFNDFRCIIFPERTEPLSQQESDDVCRDLNAIYIHILGLLDNYAWLLVHQMATEATKALDRRQIGLFMSALSKDANLAKGMATIEPFRDWLKEVKEKRDPAAHRMPLYVPPTALTPEDVQRYEEIEQAIMTARRQGQFDGLEELRDAQRRIGRLIPAFLHDPTEGAMPIFPTLPQDIGKAILIGKIVQAMVRESCPRVVGHREGNGAGRED